MNLRGWLMGRWDGRERRKDSGNRLILEVPLTSNLDELLRLIADALKSHGSGNNLEVLTAINNLDRKVDTMSSNIDRIEKEAADAAENVGLVRTALDTLNTTVSELKIVVADLQSQVAQGQVDQARLDAAAAKLEQADVDLDALVLPPTPTEGGGGTGGTGGGEPTP